MHCQINKLSILENTTTPLDLTTIKKESQSTKFIPVTSIRDLVPIRREGIWRRSSQSDESETINKMKDQQTLLNLLTDKVFYISHPSISSLECNVSLKGPHVDTALFILLVAEILKLSRFNLIDIKIDYKTFSLHFKDVAAMKLLNLIFKDRFDHVLYPLYYKWIEGAEWMSKV
jgi:hypothetical protein